MLGGGIANLSSSVWSMAANTDDATPGRFFIWEAKELFLGLALLATDIFVILDVVDDAFKPCP